LKPAELPFAVHTYYALFMKLLASEIVAFFHRLPTPLERMMTAGTSNKLKREMEDLEAGSIFRHLNITNFLEGDLFAGSFPLVTPRGNGPSPCLLPMRGDFRYTTSWRIRPTNEHCEKSGGMLR
jgi:hypothetical protein